MFSMSKRNFFVGMAFGMVIIFFFSKMRIGTWNDYLLTKDLSEDEGNQIVFQKEHVPVVLQITTKDFITSEKLPNSTTDNKEKKTPCVVPPIDNVDQFFDYENKEKHCENLVLFGGLKKKQEVGKYKDGGKWICLDKEYDIKPGNCTVLSFGISGDWSFDDAMDKYGCKVYSFDPTIGKTDHNRSANIQFFNLGLSDIKQLKKFGKKKGHVDRLEGILQRLNLINHEIDYLKIDIEGSEMNFFKDIFITSPHLLNNIKQIGMEIHPGVVTILNYKVTQKSSFYKLWKGIHQLECAGFKLLNFEQNLAGRNPYRWKKRKVSACSEIVWGKVPA